MQDSPFTPRTERQTWGVLTLLFGGLACLLAMAASFNYFAIGYTDPSWSKVQGTIVETVERQEYAGRFRERSFEAPIVGYSVDGVTYRAEGHTAVDPVTAIGQKCMVAYDPALPGQGKVITESSVPSWAFLILFVIALVAFIGLILAFMRAKKRTKEIEHLLQRGQKTQGIVTGIQELQCCPNNIMQSYKNLIIVTGHAAFKNNLLVCPDNPEKDEHWVLMSFQHGEPPYYIEHIKKGVELLQQDSASLLLFSGGRTRKEAGHWSEAASYRAIAEHYDYWGTSSRQPTARVALEEHARDSFQNLEYGLYRFYQLEGTYPRHITVVGWQFKAERFDLHRKALHIPEASFTYVGVNNPEDLGGAQKGETRAVEQFRADPTGAHSPLADKRIERNPFDETSPYDSCPLINISE